MGPFPFEGDEEADLINAGTQTIITLAGVRFFDSAVSLGMIRGQHIDLTILIAMEVSENGAMPIRKSLTKWLKVWVEQWI
jgi:3-oxoacid CoA-transferase subunit B